MKHCLSSPPSSSGMSKFDSFPEERRQNEMAPFNPMVNTNMMHENAYSKHSAWVHPAIAYHNRFPPAFVPKLSWRKGKWTEEEEIFTKKLIDAFNGGYLKVSSSTTLRSFLAERLCCDPMRITKKFAGSSCIGKQVCVAGDGVIDETKRKQIQDELKALEETFMAKVEYLHKINHPTNQVPMGGRMPMEAGRHPHPSHPHAMQHPQQHPAMINGYASHGHYYPQQSKSGPGPSPHQSASTSSESHGSSPHRRLLSPRGSYPFAHLRDNNLFRAPEDSGSSGMGSSFDGNSQYIPNPQQQLRRMSHNHGMPPEDMPPYRQALKESSVPAYRPRQAHTSADLFGRQYPTTIEQMTFLSSENLRKKLAADNTMPSNGFHSGGRMGMGDAAKFCSAAAHAYSGKIQDDSAGKVKVKEEYHSTSTAVSLTLDSYKSGNSLTTEAFKDKRKEVKQVDLEASDLLLNFFNAAGSSSSSSSKDGSTCGSSASGSTSNQGEHDGDDSVSTFSDAMDADVSTSISGRESSLSSDRSDNNSDIDYSSPDDNECNPPPEIKIFPAKIKNQSTYNKGKDTFEDNFVAKKQRIN